MSLWSAITEAIERRLLPQRACAALKGFKDLIEDARAMLLGTFAERVSETAQNNRGDAEARREPEPEYVGEGLDGLTPPTQAAQDEDTSFEFGLNDQQSLFANDEQSDDSATKNNIEFTAKGIVATVDHQSLNQIKKKFERLAKKANSLKIQPPELAFQSINSFPVRYQITFSFNPPSISGWTLLGILHHRNGNTEVHPMAGQQVPQQYQEAGPDCDHCETAQRRKDTFILQNENKEVRQVGRTCLKDFFGGLNPEPIVYFSDAIDSLRKDISELSAEDVVEDVEASSAELGSIPAEPIEGFRAPGGPASVPEILKFLMDRTEYIKELEKENTPDSLARIDNLRELVNAAMDSRDRGETLAEFLDHAALVSDVDNTIRAARLR